jgi:hypothetical protein
MKNLIEEFADFEDTLIQAYKMSKIIFIAFLKGGILLIINRKTKEMSMQTDEDLIAQIKLDIPLESGIKKIFDNIEDVDSATGKYRGVI